MESGDLFGDAPAILNVTLVVLMSNQGAKVPLVAGNADGRDKDDFRRCCGALS